MAEALDALVALVCKPQGQPQQVEAAVKRLVAAFGSRAASSGKENTSTKQLKAAALQCFKAAQAQLADGRSSAGSSSTAFISLGQASLRTLEAHAGGSAAATQLLPLRYNFVKRLAAAGCYSAAWQEAVTLREQLGGGGLQAPVPRLAEAANMAVGAVLMLLLCCAEGKAAAGDWLPVSLEATQGLEEWLGVLPHPDAEKHRDAIFKYLYKAAVQLLEKRKWDRLPAVLAAMAGVAASEQHMLRVLQTTHKFAAHMPDSLAAEAAAAAAAALIGRSGQLPGSVPQEVVSLLCMACQRATSADAASRVWSTAFQCTSLECETLQQAALLLPALAVSQSGACDGWVQPVMQATDLASASAAALQQACVVDAQRHASVVAAAFQAANLLRKVLANKLLSEQGGAHEVLGGSHAEVAVAAALDVLGVLVATARALAATTDDAVLGAAMSTVGSQVHAATAGLGTAAKLKAACAARPDAPSVVDAGALTAVLGWNFNQYCSYGGQLPCGIGVLSGQELCWLAAALNNVGVDLHGEGLYEAATPALLGAVSASVCSLMEAIAQGAGAEVVVQRAKELAKRSSALSDAQLRAGATAAAATTLAHAVAALVQCGLGATVWEDLLGRCVKMVHVLLSEQEKAGAALPAPAPKGRGSRATKGAASKGKAGDALGREALAQLSCSKVLCEHSQWIPAVARASVAAHEISMWAALASDGGNSSGSSTAGAHAAQVCRYLLTEAFPAKQFPAGHVRVLLAAYQAGISAGELAGKEILAQAAAVLDTAKQDGAETALVAAKVYGLMALGAAQQLVEQSMEEQRQQRQQQRAQQAAAPSSSPGATGAGSFDSLSSLNTKAWQEVAAQAGVALEHAEALLSHAEALQPDDMEPLCHLVAELCYMVALQGQEQVEARCQRLFQELLSLPGHTLSDSLAQWAAITPASGFLTRCLSPGIRPALAQCMPALEGSFEAWPASMAALFHTASGGKSELASLDSCLEQLALAPRHAGTSLQRANLHRLAAEQAAGAGSVLCGLYHATEAHRLVASVAASHTQPTPGAHAAGLVGWWQLAAEQLCSLLQLGRLFELSGMADEALQAFKEGLRMATSIGSQPLAASFQVMLADIYSKQGNAAAARAAVQPVAGLLEAGLTEGPILGLLSAQLRLMEARLSMAASEHDAAKEHCQAAVGLCAKASATVGSEPSLAAQLAVVHASAVLASAQCLAAEGDALGSAKAAQQAAQLLSSSVFELGGIGPGIQPWAEVLLFQALSAARVSISMQQQGVDLWGLQPGSGPQAPSSTEAGAPKAAGKKPTGRGGARARATKQPAEEPVAAGGSGMSSLQQQQLWQAYWVTREIPHLNRIAASHLASECGRAGYVHLAALLLHSSLGATLRQQYRLVLHTKLRQLEQRASKTAAPDAEEQCCMLRSALSELDDPLDAQLVCQLAGMDVASGQVVQQRRQQQAGRRRGATPAAPTPEELLAQLERQSEAALRRWVGTLPEGTVVCSISSEPAVGSGFLPAGSKDEGLVVSRIAAGAPPVVMRLPARESQRGGLKQHPIKALSLGEEDGDISGASWAAHPLAADMHWLLEESGRSMQDMATDTREQQREWWHARLGLDDQLAALLQAMDSSWLGCWRCLLLGGVPELQEQVDAVDRLVEQLQSHLVQSGRQALAEQPLAVLHAALVSVLQGGGGPESPQVQEASSQLCKCLGLELSPEQVAAVLHTASDKGSISSPNAAPAPGQIAGGRAAVAGTRQRASSSAAREDNSVQLEASSIGSDSVAVPKAAAPVQGRRAKTVTFQVQEPGAQPEQPPQQQPSRSQRSSARGRPAAAVAVAAATPAQRNSSAAESGSNCTSSTTAAVCEAAAAAEQPDGSLCEALGAMSLDAGMSKPQAQTTAQASKHRSRLKMMQASTPGPGTASTAARGAGTAGKASATAPRLRRCVSAAALGEGSTSSSTAEVDGNGGSAAIQKQQEPVVLVIDGALQALPWESMPGLRSQRIYRIPSLASAVACAHRSAREVDLSSTFYTLNPSGDLTATQSAFQDWFSRLPWEGKVGEPPTPAELASALQSHQLFVYFGHGGGDQYIPAGKLRSLDSCSAALLMGCSSGRLCPRQLYEPTGPVLAYLLAGCPVAVANLWDVTDKDIDRFSQALLSSWLDKKGEERPCVLDISAAVATSRAACKLPHLIGAAPVCYGVPTSVQ